MNYLRWLPHLILDWCNANLCINISTHLIFLILRVIHLNPLNIHIMSFILMLPCLRPTCAGYTAPCPYPCFKISMQQTRWGYIQRICQESCSNDQIMSIYVELVLPYPFLMILTINPCKMLIPVIIRNICAVSVCACACACAWSCTRL